MTTYQWIVFVVWIIFILVWGITALSAKRSMRRPGWSWRLGFIVILIILVKLGVFNNISWAYGRPSLGPIVPLFGALCVFLGVGLAIWARFHLGRNWGMPMSEKSDTELVTSGPYSYIRHPIYTGILLAIFGTALVDGLILLIPFIGGFIYFAYSATQEEKRMLTLFPDTYGQYMRHTSRLIPFIY